MGYEPKDASAFTTRANQEARARYALDDTEDFDLADRGFIAPIPGGVVPAGDGKVSVDLADFDFIEGDAPATVNPSLWRQSQVMRKAGLYRVVDRIYQVRNTDIANVTFVEGDDGVIVIDCSANVHSARQALELLREHVTDKPVVAVIYTHTHVDHYGGVKGVVDPARVADGSVPIIAPGTIASFDTYAIGENVVAGNAMSRRAGYAFGSLIGHGDHLTITAGIGIATAANSEVSYLSPTDPITETGQRRVISGLTFEFLYAPDTEAPEEMHIWIPELKALTCAENANHSLHNIQTLRGARTRDARNFARYLDETLVRWGDDVEVHYGPHTWPVWGNAEVVAFIESQRDTYKYIHDQALRLANQGYTPLEAAEVVELPDVLGRKWFNRGYHGTLHHDVRAVFTKELGMWDGDPVSLHPHTPVDTAERYLALVGRDALVDEGRRAIAEGDYRWATQVLHHVVFARPDDTEAKGLQADAYEQLGYQVEGPQWRGIYLAAARELREGIAPAAFATASPDTILAMPLDILFDFAAVHVNGPRAAEVDVRIDLRFTDSDETWTMWVRNGVLNARPGASAAAQLTVSAPKGDLVGVLLQPAAAGKLADAGRIALDGDRGVLDTYAGVLDEFDPDFAIVTP
ncbi:alkyl/aryl-sulfatase [Agromyces aerolatus]|uniref:alkyl/aryl-sulfatase n=1 Tax=Agromyces sp. LY-1074 TaxID=3074080 RepID=UPI00286619C7|nr:MULTISPECIES: alkyl sulfatase dimerization domain-containing protein [unclassified Agromyces]MDR5698622.1 alkyl sulfatase dimerization domain-containing protein [Agromyces sp. LY-1074]MDR5704916.1 alkyl sulfatase dimerization domain-containing protein [Agromyces sp. LY-1358]